MVDVATLTTRFPALACAEPTLIQIALADAQQDISRTEWGFLADRATYLLAAHYLVTNPAVSPDTDGGSRAIASYSVPGRLSATKAADRLDRSQDLNRSPYGIQFQALKKRAILRFGGT